MDGHLSPHALKLIQSGQLDKSIELLHCCIQVEPQHSHAYVALALAHQRKGDLKKAKEYTMRALAAGPNNPVALKNLGAILGKEGDSLKALYYLTPVLRDRAQRPSDRIRPCLCLPEARRCRAGPESVRSSPDDGGSRGSAPPGQGRVARDCSQ